MIYEDIIARSSLVEKVIFSSEDRLLTIFFKRYYIDQETYVDFPFDVYLDFLNSPSLGKFYLSKIKHIYKLQKTSNMASDRILKIKINTRDIKKEWLFIGEKGVYLNATLFLNDEDNQSGLCGTIVQDVPSEIYEDEKHLPKDKRTSGPIIGNTKQFKKKSIPDEAKAGSEGGRLAMPSEDPLDDLPF